VYTATLGLWFELGLMLLLRLDSWLQNTVGIMITGPGQHGSIDLAIS